MTTFLEKIGQEPATHMLADGQEYRLAGGTLTLKNTSGVRPLDMRVIVKLDSAERKIGNIIIPESAAEKDDWAQMKATLIAVGGNAWAEAKAGGETVPQPGDRIMVAKYGGKEFTGADGEKYKIMNDDDVTGVLEGGA